MAAVITKYLIKIYQLILNLNMDDISVVSMPVAYPAGTAPVKQK